MKRSITGLRVRFLSVTILIGHGRTGKSTGNTRADTGAVTLIQRFGSAANLNIHLHCLVLDGVYLNRDGAAVFHEAAAPSSDELARGCAAENHHAHDAVIDAPGGSHRRTRPDLPRRNGHRWGAAGSAGRLVHLSYCAGPTSWAETAELAKPAERSHGVRPGAACQRARL